MYDFIGTSAEDISAEDRENLARRALVYAFYPGYLVRRYGKRLFVNTSLDTPGVSYVLVMIRRWTPTPAYIRGKVYFPKPLPLTDSDIVYSYYEDKLFCLNNESTYVHLVGKKFIHDKWIVDNLLRLARNRFKKLFKKFIIE